MKTLTFFITSYLLSLSLLPLIKYLAMGITGEFKV